MATRQQKPTLVALLSDEDQIKLAAQQSANGVSLEATKLALVADIWFSTYTERLAADKVAAKLKTQEEAAKALLLEQMRMQGLTAIGGAKVRVGMDPTPDYQPHIKDWEVFYKYILKTKDFSLLERRPGRAAIKERWEDGKEVPGVEKFPVYKLTRNEVK